MKNVPLSLSAVYDALKRDSCEALISLHVNLGIPYPWSLCRSGQGDVLSLDDHHYPQFFTELCHLALPCLSIDRVLPVKDLHQLVICLAGYKESSQGLVVDIHFHRHRQDRIELSYEHFCHTIL